MFKLFNPKFAPFYDWNVSHKKTNPTLQSFYKEFFLGYTPRATLNQFSLESLKKQNNVFFK